MFGLSTGSSENGSKDEIVLLPTSSKHGIVKITEIETHVSAPEPALTALENDRTADMRDVLWLPRESSSSDDTGTRVRRGLKAEKEMTLLACFRQYPKAIGWSLLLFLTVVMEGYGKSLISGFIALPAFRRRYGVLSESPSGQIYEISPLWQMGLQNAAVGCEVLGLLAHGYVTYHIGYRKMMLLSLVWMCFGVFPAFFANNIVVLIVSQAMCASLGWLIRREKRVEARHALQQLTKQSHLDIDDTIAVMEHTNRVERKLNYGGASYADLFRGANLRRTEISCMVWSVQALCGWTLTGYAPYFLEQAGFDSSKSFSLATGMYGMALVGGIISWFLLSYVGRRKLYLTGLFASVILLSLGGILAVALNGHSALNWSLGAILITTTFAYNLTLGPTCYVIVAEIPSTRLRVKTIALARVVYNIFTIINNVIAPQMLNPTAWDLQGKSCFVYAGTALLCLVWTYFRLPETQKLSYFELDMLFEKEAPTFKFAELGERLANSAYLTVTRAERMRNAWHGWLTYS
ncbi:putative maltose permease (MalP) [Ilyonectria robusta]